MCSASTGWRAHGKRLLRSARAGLKWAVRPGNGDVFRPDYSDAALFAVLARNSSDIASNSIREALHAWKAGARHEARQQVVAHFDCETRSRFFFDTADAAALAEAVSQASRGWRDRLERWTSGVTTEALEVYGHPIAPLRPGFPWAERPGVALDDVLFAARPHRFAFAPPLACATLAGMFSADRFRELLLNWCEFAASARPRPAFISTLVVTQRLLACNWAYAMLGTVAGGAPAALVELKWQLLKLMGQDIVFLEPRLGSSYPNNHLLVDRFAAWYVPAVLPDLCGGTGTLDEAERLWLEECERQTYPDGGYFEPAVRYHGLATELLAAYVILARRQRRRPLDWVLARHEAMLRFQAALAGPDAQPPEIGDGTEDPMFPLVTEARSAAGLTALYRMQRVDGAKAAEPNAGKEWATWMSGGRADAAVEERPSEEFAAFTDMGVFVFSEDGGRTRLVLRTAPAPERAVMPGHMHSDLMSIYLVESGTPLIIDSGTFTYRFGDQRAERGATNWRAYLTGASAHNTVLIAGQDPLGAQTGDFRSNVQVPRARTLSCRASSRLAVAAARLEGEPLYAGLVRGVLHVREEYFLAWCALPEGVAVDAAQFLFQLAPGTDVRFETTHLKLENASVSMEIAYSSGLAPEATRHGSENPLGGWVSPRFAERLPAPQLAFRACGESRLSAVLFQRSGKHAVTSVACAITVSGAGLIRIETADSSDLVVLNIGQSDGIRVSLEDVTFDGEVLWVRESTDGALRIRSLATRAIDMQKHGVTWTAGAGRQDFEYSK